MERKQELKKADSPR